MTMATGEPLFLGVFSDTCWGVFEEGLRQLFLELDPVGCVRKIDYYLPCALDILSKAASYAIIAGALVLKLPQILAIASAKSAAGLSRLSMEMDVLVFVASVAYSSRLGYDFSTYGEQVIVLAQNVLLVLLAYVYAEAPVGGGRVLAFVGGLGAAVAACAALPERHLWALSAASICANVASRVPQLLANAAQQHTGRLAGATVKLNALGALVRFLTTLKETADPVLLLGFGTSTLLNVALLAQLKAYAENTRAALAKHKAE